MKMLTTVDDPLHTHTYSIPYYQQELLEYPCHNAVEADLPSY